MRTILLLALFTACGGSDDERKLESGVAMRRAALDDLNKTARETTGQDRFRIDGKHDEDLVFTPTNCSLAMLNDLLRADGMRMTLKLYDFRSIRCEGGIKVTPPWE
jgi:hypothetical protein